MIDALVTTPPTRDYAADTLTREQIGHLRHYDNLSRLPRNDWSGMGSRAHGQEGPGALRYQLAYMIYALALTHRHRLPAAPGLFQPTIQRLIDKLLLPEVWLYWKDMSTGGAFFNEHLDLDEEWDPVVRDNIMYSAYVQSAAALHDYLFDSSRYAEPGALTFQFWSMHWGGGEKKFAYDRRSLTEHIYWQMVQAGYLGVPCEPNCIFQVCIQPALLGFRLQDLADGGALADEAIAGYRRAWEDYSRLDDTGHYYPVLMQDSKVLIPNANRGAAGDAWLGTLMNMWNRDVIREHYPRQSAELLVRGPGGTLSVIPPVGKNEAEAVGAREVAETDGNFGWMTTWTSEVGDAEVLAGLLEHADRFMTPSWRDGGLYYRRNDTVTDADGNLTEVGPMTGNVLIGYGRLNRPDGLWHLFNTPLDEGWFDRPALTTVDRDVEVSRAFVDADGALHTRLRRITEVPGDGTVRVSNVVGRGSWTIDVDGRRLRVEAGTLRADGPTPAAAISLVGDDVVVTCDGTARAISVIPDGE